MYNIDQFSDSTRKTYLLSNRIFLYTIKRVKFKQALILLNK